MMKYVLTFFFLASLVQTQAQQMVPLDDKRWEFFEREPRNMATIQGEKALYLNGKAFLKDIPFRDGAIEFEFTAARLRAFAGFIFRAEDEGNFEALYIRLHKSNDPDALQYNPEYNEEANWQLYGEHQANVSFDQSQWNKLRIEVRGSEMKVFLNGPNNLVMTVPNLRRDKLKGFIGFYSFLGAYFKNFSYELFDREVPALKRADTKPGVISKWELSQARALKDVNISNYSSAKKQEWTEVATEPSGLLPINKYIKREAAGNFEGNDNQVVWARHRFNSDRATTRKFYFDFSDNIEVFINGELVFSGRNSFRYKGLTFRGDVRLEGNMLYVKTKKGENEILCAVSDKANGWGLMGKLE